MRDNGPMILLITGVLSVIIGMGLWLTDTKPEPAPELSRVTPMQIEHDEPQLLMVEFRDDEPRLFSPCASEDSTDCFWWAPTRGNGKGRPFINVDSHTLYL